MAERHKAVHCVAIGPNSGRNVDSPVSGRRSDLGLDVVATTASSLLPHCMQDNVSTVWAGTMLEQEDSLPDP